jgi:hypothetical protein
MATSKQPKQPPFPHPPLEQGVAQYPTPLVPNYNDKKGGWSINDQGHIILVEKVSIEKGNFTPQPLDGSVTYAGRDANKWPSTLYLVAEKPTPDGEFIYRYWANDRTLSSQNLWNYGLDYSSNNPSYPITSRTYIVPRSQYATVGLGSTDPVFGGTQIISQQKMMELPEENPLASRYVAVQRVYESIPGPVITGKKYDSRGDLETVNVQTVAAGTAPASDGLYVTDAKVDPVDSVKSTKTTATVQSYATLTTKANKAGLQGDTSTTDDIVSPSTDPDALSTTVLESTVEQLTTTKARKRTTTSSGPTELDSKEYKSGLLGETTRAESIVSYGSSPDQLSTTILQSEVTAIDAYKSKKTTITSIGPSELDGVATKSGLLGNTSTAESIVAYGSDADALSTTVIESIVTPIDAYKSKKTTISSSGPTSLTGDEKKGGLLGITETVESIVSAGSSPDDLSTTVLQSQVTPIDSAKSKKTTVTTTGPTELDGSKYDEFFQSTLTITEQIVAYDELPLTDSSTGYSGGENGYLLTSKDDPIDLFKKRRSIVSTHNLPPDRIEYKTASYSTPQLIFNLVVDSFAISTPDIRYRITPVTRAAQSRLTMQKITTSFTYGAPTAPEPSGILSPELKRVAYTGYNANFDLGDALCDQLQSFNVGTTITLKNINSLILAGYFQGNITIPVYEHIDIAATSIDATTYLSYIGTYQITSFEQEYYKSGIWVSRTVETYIV